MAGAVHHAIGAAADFLLEHVLAEPPGRERALPGGGLQPLDHDCGPEKAASARDEQSAQHQKGAPQGQPYSKFRIIRNHHFLFARFLSRYHRVPDDRELFCRKICPSCPVNFALSKFLKALSKGPKWTNKTFTFSGGTFKL